MANVISESGINTLALPPAVDYPLTPARLLRGIVLLCWSLAMAVDAYWVFVAPAGDWRPWAGIVVSVVAAGLAWRCGPLTQSGVLAWDGGHWWWERAAAPVPGDVAVRLDMQWGLLLRFVTDSGSAHWFWLDRATSPVHWLALRRAAFAAPGRRTLPASVPAGRTVLP